MRLHWLVIAYTLCACERADDPSVAGTTRVCGAISVTRRIVRGPIDLTAEGTSDWAAWGATSVHDFDRKATGGGQIAAWSVVGAGIVYGYGNAYHEPGTDGFTWRDGTPVAVEATPQYSGVWIDGAPNGFATTAPAGASPHTLRVYVGGADATGTFTAHLSDGSAPDYVDANGLGSVAESWAGVYQLVYRSASPSARIEVSWIQSSAGGGDVNFSAASLQ
ncbi:MAG TPA: hypothetical protein VMJ10_20275 [Kofleriaceae bacterium]|nr:hypothetical protein [Kofleriaceae bacterium]